MGCLSRAGRRIKEVCSGIYFRVKMLFCRKKYLKTQELINVLSNETDNLMKELEKHQFTKKQMEAHRKVIKMGDDLEQIQIWCNKFNPKVVVPKAVDVDSILPKTVTELRELDKTHSELDKYKKSIHRIERKMKRLLRVP